MIILIDVSISCNGIKVKGHAGYDVKGKDIVCAAVSALTYTLKTALESLSDDAIHCIDGDGYTIIKFEELTDAGKLLVDAFFLGILGVEEEYPEYVRLAP